MLICILSRYKNTRVNIKPFYFLHLIKKYQMRIKEIISENIYGILGTLAFHMILGIFFLGIKISVTKKHIEQNRIIIDFEKELPDIEKLVKEKEALALEEKAQIAVERELKKNIGVNVADDFKKEISTDNYLEELSKDYKIESYGKGPEEESFGDLQMPEEKEKKEQKDKSQYKGPTNITYNLKNRFDKRLFVPVYLCTGSGKVVVNIMVDRKGYVTSATINEDKSNTYNNCLYKAAQKAALNTIFNTKYDAPLRQEGTITYQFVAQETLN